MDADLIARLNIDRLTRLQTAPLFGAAAPQVLDAFFACPTSDGTRSTLLSTRASDGDPRWFEEFDLLDQSITTAMRAAAA